MQVAPMFNQWGVSITPNSQIKTLSISGPADKVAAVEAAIKQLDVAPKTIELTVYFVVGGDQATLAGGAVPQDLRDVITQLKGAFTFKDYKMLDVLTLRTRAGSSAETSGILNAGNPPRMSQFSIRNATVSEDGTTVRIDRMHAGLRIPFTRREGVGADAKGGRQRAEIRRVHQFRDRPGCGREGGSKGGGGPLQPGRSATGAVSDFDGARDSVNHSVRACTWSTEKVLVVPWQTEQLSPSVGLVLSWVWATDALSV